MDESDHPAGASSFSQGGGGGDLTLPAYHPPSPQSLVVSSAQSQNLSLSGPTKVTATTHTHDVVQAVAQVLTPVLTTLANSVQATQAQMQTMQRHVVHSLNRQHEAFQLLQQAPLKEQPFYQPQNRHFLLALLLSLKDHSGPLSDHLHCGSPPGVEERLGDDRVFPFKNAFAFRVYDGPRHDGRHAPLTLKSHRLVFELASVRALYSHLRHYAEKCTGRVTLVNLTEFNRLHAKFQSHGYGGYLSRKEHFFVSVVLSFLGKSLPRDTNPDALPDVTLEQRLGFALEHSALENDELKDWDDASLKRAWGPMLPPSSALQSKKKHCFHLQRATRGGKRGGPVLEAENHQPPKTDLHNNYFVLTWFQLERALQDLSRIYSMQDGKALAEDACILQQGDEGDFLSQWFPDHRSQVTNPSILKFDLWRFVSSSTDFSKVLEGQWKPPVKGVPVDLSLAFPALVAHLAMSVLTPHCRFLQQLQVPSEWDAEVTVERLLEFFNLLRRAHRRHREDPPGALGWEKPLNREEMLQLHRLARRWDLVVGFASVGFYKSRAAQEFAQFFRTVPEPRTERDLLEYLKQCRGATRRGGQRSRQEDAKVALPSSSAAAAAQPSSSAAAAALPPSGASAGTPEQHGVKRKAEAARQSEEPQAWTPDRGGWVDHEEPAAVQSEEEDGEAGVPQKRPRVR